MYLVTFKTVFFYFCFDVLSQLLLHCVTDAFFFSQVNEAFAAQYLSVAKALGLDPEKSNVNGGAIAIGHPLGASGTRITAHLVHELRQSICTAYKGIYLHIIYSFE